MPAQVKKISVNLIGLISDALRWSVKLQEIILSKNTKHTE